MSRPYIYFEMPEFYCKCGKCGSVGVDRSLVHMLDEARGIAGVPMRINSGHRCDAHNRAVGGREGSTHTLGLAADIACTSSPQRWAMLTALIEAGFNRIGVSSNFIHVDIDDAATTKQRPSGVVWTY